MQMRIFNWWHFHDKWNILSDELSKDYVTVDFDRRIINFRVYVISDQATGKMMFSKNVFY